MWRGGGMGDGSCPGTPWATGPALLCGLHIRFRAAGARIEGWWWDGSVHLVKHFNLTLRERILNCRHAESVGRPNSSTPAALLKPAHIQVGAILAGSRKATSVERREHPPPRLSLDSSGVLLQPASVHLVWLVVDRLSIVAPELTTLWHRCVMFLSQ